VKISVTVSRAEFPERLSLGLAMWEYLDTIPSHYKGVTPENYDVATRLIRDYQLDCPWASSLVCPPIDGSYFDENDQLLKPLDFSRFKEWTARFPDAATYYVLAHAKLTGDFAGTNCFSDPECFTRRFRAWLRAWETELDSLGIAQERLVLHFVDEPNTVKRCETLVAWAKALEAGRTKEESGIRLFCDPNFKDCKRFAELTGTEIFAAIDIFCPNLYKALLGNRECQGVEYLKSVRDQFPGFGFYSCEGDIERLDPYVYYLLQSWFCAAFDAEVTLYWQFVDKPSPTRFNAYAWPSAQFSPLYSQGAEIFGSRQWEALYEGRCDAEYVRIVRRILASLRANGGGAEAVTEIETVLHEAVAATLGPAENAADFEEYVLWRTGKARDEADRQRARLFGIIERFHGSYD